LALRNYRHSVVQSIFIIFDVLSSSDVTLECDRRTDEQTDKHSNDSIVLIDVLRFARQRQLESTLEAKFRTF